MQASGTSESQQSGDRDFASPVESSRADLERGEDVVAETNRQVAGVVDNRLLERRSADEVLDDHLQLRKLGAVELDITRNYSPEVVLLCGRELFRGHNGIRQSASLLEQQ